MKSESKDVVFRRIRGRVVPIRLKKTEAADIGKGTAAVVAGAAVGAAGGAAFKKTVTSGAKLAFRASSLFDKIRSRSQFGKQLEFTGIMRHARAQKTARKAMDFALKAEKTSSLIKVGASAAAVGLSAYGIHKLATAYAKRTNSDKPTPGGTAASAAALASGAFLVGMHGRAGISHVATKAARYAPVAKEAFLRFLRGG